jgi:hypothetical protein
MEIVNETIENLENLSDERKSQLAKDIAGKFKLWDDDRSEQIDTARSIMDEVYLHQGKKKREKELEWKSDVKLNALYNIKRTRKAQLWSEMWSNSEQMFDVKGTNEQTEETAKQQKAAIVDSLNKMEVQRQYDKVADDLFDIGEMIFKTDWEQRKKVVKRQRKDVGFVIMNVLRNAMGSGYTMSEKMQDVEIPYYENARVEEISPFMFVFDHSKYIQGDKKRWDSLWKIYKRFDTFENIRNNKVYDITPEIIERFENKEPQEKTAENKELVELRDKNEFGGQLAILYCHGDFKINGKLYKNYIAEVLAGEYLIRFEENPLFINPFIYCALEIDPLTKRGISPLKCALSLAREQERLANTAMDIQKLRANPPVWAPEGLFDENNTNKDGTVPIAPGKVLEFKNDFSGQLPTPVTLSGEGINDLINYSDQKISDLTSVSNFMYGNVTDTKRTATELSLVDKGASAQTSKELDIINQDLTIPMIENVAELLAMFKDGTDYVYTKEQGKDVEYTITNAIRQAQYEYVYEDRNAIENRKQKFDQVFSMMQAAGQNAQLFNMFDWKEVYTTGFEMQDFDNPDKFFADDTPADKFAQELKQIPPELQQQAVGMLQQYLGQMTQQYQAQQQQQAMQQQAQNQVQMQMYRDQARQQAENEMMQEAING